MTLTKLKMHTMKKITCIAIALSIFAACSDQNQPDKENRVDTSKGNIQTPPSSTDTSANRGDTSMYQRMPNKTSDSTPR